MIDLRPLASYISNEYGLDYEQMLDTLFDFFIINKEYTGFFVPDNEVFKFPEKLHAGDSGSVDDYII